MEKVICIAIDAMGGDHGPVITVPAALSMLASHSYLHLILVGDADLLQHTLLQQTHAHYDSARLQIQHASQSVEMDESPTQALRSKKDSSMRVAINLVKEGKAQACVSAGNTGALMATARFVLKTLPGIDRPAIISIFPTKNPDRNVRILDLGANVDSNADQLAQFAVMGSVLASVIDNIEQPTVCLLNIGEEEIKGNEQVKKTAQLLAHSHVVNYAGYIEGDAVYQGNVDVVVCDGFVGNVALKTSEGVAILISQLIKEAFMRTLWTKLLGQLVTPILRTVTKRIDPTRYNGAMFIGLQEIVIKSHGGANQYAFAHAIKEAMQAVEKNVLDSIRHQIEQLLTLSPPTTHE